MQEAEILGRIVINEGCWTWLTSQPRRAMVRTPEGGLRIVYSLLYEMFVGPIPDGHDLHHTCGNGDYCVRFDHVEPIPHGEHSSMTNLRDPERCSRGHLRAEFERVYTRGHRVCLACQRERIAERRARA